MTDLLANSYFAVLALILGFGFLVFIHELGHFLVAKWVGIRATQFAIGFGHALLCWRKGIGLRVGSTEPEYVKRAVEHLQSTHAKTYTGKDEVEARYDSVRVHEESLDPRYTERQVHEAADALGLGETEYRLNWMPLGGYVKMLGQEDMDPNAMSDDPRAYNRKSIGGRMAVISAGVVMNLVFGMLFLIVAFSDFAGVKFPAPYVGDTFDGTPAATTYANGHAGDPAYLGLQPGDHITHVDGKPIEDLVAVRIAGALGEEDVPVDLTVERAGLDEPLTYAITAARDELRADGMLSLGIQPAFTLRLDRPANPDAWAATPWAQAGVEPGMSVVAVDDQPVDTTAALREVFDASDGAPVTVTFGDAKDADAQRVSVTVNPSALLPIGPSDERSLLGLLPPATVLDVVPDSPAADAELQPGDVLARVGPAVFPSVSGVIEAVQNAGSDGVAVEVLRDGQRVSLGRVKPAGGRLGIALEPGLDSPAVRGVEGGGALADLNLPPGSRLTSINGEPVENLRDALRQLQTIAAAAATTNDNTGQGEAAASVDVEFGFVLNLGEEGQPETTSLSLDADALAMLDTARWVLPAALPFEAFEVRVAGDTLGEAASIGTAKTVEFVQQTYITLLRLFQGTVRIDHLRGPVGIVDAGATVAARGWPYYLFFLGIISINLAVINFLPLPIVDGGHMVFLIIEKLRGKPASPQVQTAAMILGLVLIASVFLIVTYNDIFRILTRSG